MFWKCVAKIGTKLTFCSICLSLLLLFLCAYCAIQGNFSFQMLHWYLANNCKLNFMFFYRCLSKLDSFLYNFTFSSILGSILYLNFYIFETSFQKNIVINWCSTIVTFFIKYRLEKSVRWASLFIISVMWIYELLIISNEIPEIPFSSSWVGYFFQVYIWVRARVWKKLLSGME